MEIIFEEEYLSELFFKGKCNDKKHRYQPDIVRKYQKAVVLLANAKQVEDLFEINSLNYEVLSGDKKGISSVRCGLKYRLEFKVSKENETLTICRLLELSNHYK